MDKQISVSVKRPSANRHFDIKYLNGIRASIISADDGKENSFKMNADSSIEKIGHRAIQDIVKKLTNEIILSDGKRTSTLKAFDVIIEEEVEKSPQSRDVILTFESMKQKIIDNINNEATEKIDRANKMNAAALSSKTKEMEVLNSAFNEKTQLIAHMNKDFDAQMREVKLG